MLMILSHGGEDNTHFVVSFYDVFSFWKRKVLACLPQKGGVYTRVCDKGRICIRINFKFAIIMCSIAIIHETMFIYIKWELLNNIPLDITFPSIICLLFSNKVE